MARTLAVAIITENEADSLAKCLSTLSDLADEICVVDTGSRDNTLEIAHSHKAKVSLFIWCDDFAAARNESLRLCTADWIFVLDADERIDRADAGRLRSLIKGRQDVAYRFVTRNYSNDTDAEGFVPVSPDDSLSQGYRGWYPTSAVRLFPNHRNIQFAGRVQESVSESVAAANIPVEDLDIPILHYPLSRSAESIETEDERLRRLGGERLAAAPRDPEAIYDLGREFERARDLANAQAAYECILDIDPNHVGAMICLSRVLSARGNPEAAAEAAERALQVDPRYDRAWRQLAGIRLTQKRWEEAMEFVTKALEADPEWVQGNRLLGLALEGLGDFERAAEASEKALRGNPESAEALRQYIHQMLRLERRNEARSLLSTLVQQGTDTPLLHNALGELYYYDEDYAQARPHFSKAAQGGVTSAYNNLGVTYFMERDFENACRAFEQCLAADPRHKGARKNLMRAMGHLNKS